MTISRAEAMKKRGQERNYQFAREGKTNTARYGVLSLMYRSSIVGCIDSSYEDTDEENEVDIYLYLGEYVAVDSFDRW